MSNITPNPKTSSTTRIHWGRYVLAFLGIFVLLLLATFILDWVNSYRIPPDVQVHLDIAERKSIAAATMAEKDLHEFFAAAKQNAPLFAKHALSLSSKWRAVSDVIPFTRDDRLKEYITQRFHEDILSPGDLEKALQNILTLYLKEVESIENEMLINIQLDVPDLPPNSIMRTTSPESLGSVFQTLLVQTAKSSQSDVMRCIGRDTVAEIASTILGPLAVQMAASAGILTVGGSAAGVTVGLSIIAAVIVDLAVSWIWDWFTDPKGDIAAAICSQLDNMERLIIHGDGKTPGFREQLLKINQERTEIRQKTIQKMIHSSRSIL